MMTLFGHPKLIVSWTTHIWRTNLFDRFGTSSILHEDKLVSCEVDSLLLRMTLHQCCKAGCLAGQAVNLGRTGAGDRLKFHTLSAWSYLPYYQKQPAKPPFLSTVTPEECQPSWPRSSSSDGLDLLTAISRR
jgi:hypothetical protein